MATLSIHVRREIWDEKTQTLKVSASLHCIFWHKHQKKLDWWENMSLTLILSRCHPNCLICSVSLQEIKSSTCHLCCLLSDCMRKPLRVNMDIWTSAHTDPCWGPRPYLLHFNCVYHPVSFQSQMVWNYTLEELKKVTFLIIAAILSLVLLSRMFHRIIWISFMTKRKCEVNC